MSKILLFANHDIIIYNFRLELVEKLLKEKHQVIIAAPYGNRTDEMIKLGCEFKEIRLSRRGTNPFKDFKLMLDYTKLIKDIKPDMVFTYTIKPNVYGGIACTLKKVPYVVNVTGLGTAIENGGLMQKLTCFLYRLGCKHAKKVFFQNSANQEFMLNRKIVTGENELLPGSGVNLKKHCLEPYPDNDEKIILLTIGRIMKDKGIDEVLGAARIIKDKYPNVIFRLIGSYCDDYKEEITVAIADGLIEYLGEQSDVHSFIKESHATLHASYHEGMANVLLESAACGRPVISTDVPGCKETYDDGVSGISFKPRNIEDTVRAIEKFLNLTHEQKSKMGKAGRIKMEKEFNREIVVNKYMETINN